MAEQSGLRERKKQRTHDTIVRVAIELFAERGYHQTTVAEIAAAAEVAPSTVFAYFPTKEDIVFAPMEPYQTSFRERLEGRSAGEPAIEAFRRWALATIPEALAVPNDELLTLRRIIDSDARLQSQERTWLGQFEAILAAEIARDLGLQPDDPAARIVAGAVAGAFGAVMSDRHQVTAAERERQIELACAFANAGLQAVTRGSAAG